MRATAAIAKRLHWRLGFVALTAMVATASSVWSPDRASATVGEGYIAEPGMVDTGRGQDYRNWLRIESHYWMEPGGPMGIFQGKAARSLRGPRAVYSGPDAPASGTLQQKLVIAVDKHSPGLARMMANCASKTMLPTMNFAEPSARSRFTQQIGPRPAGMPEYFEYKLHDVQIVDCPVVEGALEQALVLNVGKIDWLNFTGTSEGLPVQLPQPALTPIKLSGATRTFVVSWFADANDVSEDQCAKMNYKPPMEDYFALMSKEDADKERAEMAAKKTSVGYENGQMDLRGPHKLSVTKLPGIIKTAEHYTPITKVAYGLDLDGSDGTGAPPAGICKHKNYLSEDGRKGIDNQLYTVQGCSGMRGHKGFYWQYANEQRRNGTNHIMVMVSGIDNDRNDDQVYVTFFFSNDVMAKNADGSKILADYTYRLNNNPEFTYYTTRLKGRIVNGSIVTERVKEFRMHTGLGQELQMFDAGLRLNIMPDGSLKGIVAGYQDWRRIMGGLSSSTVEQNFSVNIPIMYAAMKKYADGMKDPVTGLCNGISSAWAIEGSAAFIPASQSRTFVADATPKGRGAANMAR